jgi:hypothetical protein
MGEIRWVERAAAAAGKGTSWKLEKVDVVEGDVR